VDAVQLATFQTVIDQGSFDAAARALHVTPSAVSQRIKALEQTVGQVLVRRAKPCTPTIAGEALVRLATQTALLEREALQAARGILDDERIPVSVVVNADSLNTWFLPVLTELPFLFDLYQDDQDHTADLLRAGTAMAAVTSQRTPVQGCRVEPLGTMRYLAVATTAGDPATLPIVVLNRKDQLQHRFLEMLGTPGDPPTHYVPAASAITEAIRQGLGWGLLPEQVARPDIAEGRYRDLTPGRYLDVPLYWQVWRIESTALQSLTAAVRAAAARQLR
jgi:LysR family transcriptional regulator (chromosome initiation inhibitor)